VFCQENTGILKTWEWRQREELNKLKNNKLMGTEEIVICTTCDRKHENGYVYLSTKENWLLCESCAENYRNLMQEIQKKQTKTKTITKPQKGLYLALKAKGLNPELEYQDGHKTVDIAILSANLFIEVNGSQHAEDSDQLRSDLWRSYYSSKNGFLTLNVFNKAIAEDADFYKIVDVINDIVKSREKQIAEQEKTELIS
jgi:very-short-patch-repair endonuclease